MPLQLAPVPPTEAIAYFRSKGLKQSFAWEDIWQEEHGKAFTVAKMMSKDLLEDTRAALDDAMTKGQTFQQFKANLKPRLIDKGWWGKKDIKDPVTGEIINAQLGSNSRLKTIFDTNMRTSFAHGKWQAIERNKSIFPYLKYTSAGDSRVRPQHRLWDGVCLPVDHEFWDKHYPPCDWRCRCGVIQLNQRMMDRKNIKQTTIIPQNPPKTFLNKRTGEYITEEAGISPGFAFNVGRSPLRAITARTNQVAVSKQNQSITKIAIDAFLKIFGVKKKPKIIQDKNKWPLIISGDMFINIAGDMALPNKDLKLLPAAADALKNHDRAFWFWQNIGTKDAPENILIRRYEKDVDNGIIQVDFDGKLWDYRLIKK